MGIMSTIKGFVRKSRGAFKWPVVTIENRKGDNRDAQYFQSSGDDSPPLPGDNVALIDAQRQGGKLAVGIIDPNNQGTAVGGEKRLYARSPAGAVVSELHLKGDGSTVLKSISGSYILEIDAAGVAVLTCTDLTVNSPLSTFNGDVDVFGEVNVLENVNVGGGLQVTGNASGDGGPLTVAGGLTNTGGDITSDGISLETHLTSGVTAGGDVSGVPI